MGLKRAPWLPRLSSRHRVIARLVGALVVVWVIGGVVLGMTVERRLLNSLDSDMRRSAPGTAAVLETLPADVLDQLSDSVPVYGFTDPLIVYDASGKVVTIPSDTERDRSLPNLGDRTVADLRGLAGRPFTVGDVAGGDREYRVISAPLDNGGVIVVARSLDRIHDMLKALGQVLFVSFLISVVVVFVIVWVIGSQALRPLEGVIRTSQQISAGTLDTRVEVRASAAPDVERLAESINHMLARLQEAFAAKEQSEARLRQFVGDASHELRTPLAAVLGYAELYQEHMARSPEQVDKLMDRIVAEGMRMQSLVEDLLLLARMDEGRPLARDAVDLREVVDDSVSAIRVIDPNRTFLLDPGVRSGVGGSDGNGSGVGGSDGDGSGRDGSDGDGSADVAPDGSGVIGDGLALRQVVDNLLANVVHHTPPGTTARVTLDAVDGESVLRVADDGPGMSAEQRGHAFDRFWRAEQSRTRAGGTRPGGSGLGLAIVAEIVHAHGGSIDLDTAPGRGATFTVRLPTAGERVRARS